MTAKKIVQFTCVTLSLAGLLWLLSRIGWNTIYRAISQIGWLSGSLLFTLALAECVLDSMALRVVMGPLLKVGRALTVNAAGSMLNLILPWESGEVLKGTLLKGEFGTPQAVSSTIIWNYIFKISRPTLSLLSAVVAALLYQHQDRTLLFLVVGANILAFLPYVALRVLIRYGATEKLMRLLQTLPYLRRSPEHWVGLAKTIDKQVKGFWHERPWDYLQVFFLQLFARVTGWLNIYLGFQAVGAPLTFAESCLMYATMNVAEYLIAILPARVGVSEGTSFFVCKLFGFNAPLGLALYTYLRIRNILVNGLLTPFAFFKASNPKNDP